MIGRVIMSAVSPVRRELSTETSFSVASGEMSNEERMCFVLTDVSGRTITRTRLRLSRRIASKRATVTLELSGRTASAV